MNWLPDDPAGHGINLGPVVVPDPKTLRPGALYRDGDGAQARISHRTDGDDGWWLDDGSWVRDMRFVDGWMTPVDPSFAE